ncbi:hypothetical protein ACH50_12480 [Franconibacter pulveris]|uniref:Uncharacterized protein n=1 Tax=Franconibacter pulveris TaxID=435910 RepID=A0A0J8VMI1_9ENTR|nr:hypothetical protein ACH50_12480 [Franconibacter pulveris]
MLQKSYSEKRLKRTGYFYLPLIGNTVFYTAVSVQGTNKGRNSVGQTHLSDKKTFAQERL